MSLSIRLSMETPLKELRVWSSAVLEETSLGNAGAKVHRGDVLGALWRVLRISKLPESRVRALRDMWTTTCVVVP